MKSYDQILDILHDAWEYSGTFPQGGSDWVINAHSTISTLIDSFIEDVRADFEDVLDAAYEDMESIPKGKERDILRQVLDELMRYER